MNLRSFFVCGALLLLLLANSTFAGGAYQKTKDRKTRVWNNSPQPGDAATWSGDRDAGGYATGSGTLTWYITDRKYQTGSYLPTVAHIIAIRYSGNMVRGKLDGPVVNVDEKGATFHGKFANGRRVGEWATGPAPTTDQRKVVSKEADNAERPTSNVQPPAAKTPAAEPKPTPGPAQPVEQRVSKAAVKEKSNPDVDDSLRALIGPPPLLRTEAARPSLTAAEVIELADAEARAQGFDLDTYQRPQAQYSATGNTWSVSYDQKNNAGEAGKPISVKVEDKTKKTSILSGK